MVVATAVIELHLPAIHSLKQKRMVMEGEQLAAMDRVLSVIADYRRHFPRSVDKEAEAPSVVERKREVDEFLREFETEEDGNEP